MQSLDKRITALEQATHHSDTVIIIRYDCPKAPGREMFNLQGDYTDTPRQHWTRQQGESVNDFTDRASKEVKRNQYGVAMLFQCD
jgi:dihydroxyacid dehydratase/phosphogluconate dehydratase